MQAGPAFPELQAGIPLLPWTRVALPGKLISSNPVLLEPMAREKTTMEMPRPTPGHAKLQNLPGHWEGEERMHLSHGVRKLSPFLMLDHAGPARLEPSDRPRGVGEHPHRGFEADSIAYQGSVDHLDSGENSGTIYPGDVQWMTAASGVGMSTYQYFGWQTGDRMLTEACGPITDND